MNKSTEILTKSLEDKYKLAFKFFMNKSFEKSFKIIKDLFSKCIIEFRNGTVGERSFNKVANLYLVEIGLIFKDAESFLSNEELKELADECNGGYLMDSIVEAYAIYDMIPFESLYNLSLIHSINLDRHYDKSDELYSNSEKIYSLMQGNSQVAAVKKFTDLYVFEILPKLNKYDESIEIINSDKIFISTKNEAKERLEQIKQEILNKEKQAKRKLAEKKALESEYRENERRKAKELDRQNNINYKSFKQIKEQCSQSRIGARPIKEISRSVESNNFEVLTRRLQFLLPFSKKLLKENYQTILISICAIVLSVSFARKRRVNFKEKLKETISMAFKVSYL